MVHLFSKGDNFPDIVFTLKKHHVPCKKGSDLKGNNFLCGSKLFHFRVTLIGRGDKNETFTALANVPFPTECRNFTAHYSMQSTVTKVFMNLFIRKELQCEYICEDKNIQIDENTSFMSFSRL